MKALRLYSVLIGHEERTDKSVVVVAADICDAERKALKWAREGGWDGYYVLEIRSDRREVIVTEE